MPTDLNSGGTISEGLARVAPFSAICPDCKGNNPASNRNKVVFPHPECPIKQVTSPPLHSKEISFNTAFLLNRCDTLLITST
jgi:hypothetical protein